MAELKRTLIHKSIEVTINLNNFQFAKAKGSGEWAVSGDGEVTAEQHQLAETEIAIEAKRILLTSLFEMGKGVDEAVDFFAACRDRKIKRMKQQQASAKKDEQPAAQEEKKDVPQSQKPEQEEKKQEEVPAKVVQKEPSAADETGKDDNVKNNKKEKSNE
jgi:hypothetical protein